MCGTILTKADNTGKQKCHTIVSVEQEKLFIKYMETFMNGDEKILIDGKFVIDSKVPVMSININRGHTDTVYSFHL